MIDGGRREAEIFNGAIVRISTTSLSHSGEANAVLPALPGSDWVQCQNLSYYNSSFENSR